MQFEEYSQLAEKTLSPAPERLEPYEIHALESGQDYIQKAGNYFDDIKRAIFYKKEEYKQKLVMDAVMNPNLKNPLYLSKEKMDLLHAAVGLVTESIEFFDQVYKHVLLDKPLDKVNLIEELGDIDWYKNIPHRQLNISAGQVWELNIKKLEKRYPKLRFDENDAVNRNLDQERKVFE